MSKIITPPQIDDLDGLLELLLHPNKMVAYLTQLRDMRDAVNESLDAYNTKAKADALEPMRKKRAEIHRGSRRRYFEPHSECRIYASNRETCPALTKAL